MKRHFDRTFFLASTLSALSYLVCYALLASEHQLVEAGLSIAIGVSVFAVLNGIFTANKSPAHRSSKIYQLSTMLVPLCVLGYKLVAWYTITPEWPQFDAFVSFESLEWAGVFAIAFWPVFNLFILLANAVSAITMLLYVVILPLVAGAIFVVATSLVALLREIVLIEGTSSDKILVVQAVVGGILPVGLFAGLVHAFA